MDKSLFAQTNSDKIFGINRKKIKKIGQDYKTLIFTFENFFDC